MHTHQGAIDTPASESTRAANHAQVGPDSDR